MKYKHIIFDLDGTLMDTEKQILKTWQLTLKKYVCDRDYSLEELKIVLGITAQKALAKLNVRTDNNFEKQWICNYHEVAHSMTFFDGIKEMLLSLKEKGCTLGIVSSRSRKEYINYFQSFKLEEFFTIIICADDTAEHKPSPEPLFKYVELTKADLASCIYIGDMPTDIECANRAGITSGLVTWNDAKVICQDAKFEFSCPKEVCDII